MDVLAPSDVADTADLTRTASLAAELATLKRIHDASSPGSLSARLFRRAWAALCNGAPVGDVALSVSAQALAALRLGGIDQAVLLECGLTTEQAADVLRNSLHEVVGDQVSPALLSGLRRHLGATPDASMQVPPFVEQLIHQPRAGATCPGKARIILEPPESHGDHCLSVAVLGVLLCDGYGADPALVFLAGLAHHLHNATLPDAGFAGEVLLGAHLTPILRRLTDQALATLPADLATATRAALAFIPDATTPEGRAFNAADVIDRIMEVRHFANVAGFTEAHALDDMQLVHAGPLQNFHHGVMHSAGLIPG